MKLTNLFLKGVALTLFCILLNACGPRASYTISFEDSKGLVKDAELRHDGLKIGRVVQVQPAGESGGYSVSVFVDKAHQELATQKSTFIIREDSATKKPYVALVVKDKDAPMLPVGSSLVGTEKEMDLLLEKVRNIDLTSTIIVACIVVIAKILFAGILFFFLRVIPLFTAIGGGLACAWFFFQDVAVYLGPYLPADYRPDIIAFCVTALVSYLVIAILFLVLISPFRKISLV